VLTTMMDDGVRVDTAAERRRSNRAAAAASCEGSGERAVRLGSGRKVRAIETCIGNLSTEVDLIIRKGLLLADELTECAASLLASPQNTESFSGISNHRPQVRGSQRLSGFQGGGEAAETPRFPALERGLRARERFFPQRELGPASGSRRRERGPAPLADISNRGGADAFRKATQAKAPPRLPSPGEAKDQAARTIQRHYKARFRRRLQAAVCIQAHVRSYFASFHVSERKAERQRHDWDLVRGRQVLLRWKRRSACRALLRGRVAEVEGRRHDGRRRAHRHLGTPFDGEAIKPVEGVFVMAKEYQKWRLQAVAFLRWMKHATV